MLKKQYLVELRLIGSRVKKIRKQKGLTQSQLQARTGINHGDLSRIERGLKNIEVITLIKISKALRAKLSELIK